MMFNRFLDVRTYQTVKKALKNQTILILWSGISDNLYLLGKLLEKKLQWSLCLTLDDFCVSSCHALEVLEEYGSVIFLVATDNDGNIPPSGQTFIHLLNEYLSDSRISLQVLTGCRIAVVGFGSSAYEPSTFCQPAKQIVNGLLSLGAELIIPARYIDAERDTFNIDSWYEDLIGSHQQNQCCQVGNSPSCCSSVNANVDEPEIEDAEGESCGPTDMISDRQRSVLKKQGYKLVGTHSAVKLCRWTKSQMRGRGGCYKHTFYGIESFKCMEMTPSVACANKCLFCWRHHKNPVGTEWRWNIDMPEDVVKQSLAAHSGLVKQLKGIPGLLSERFESSQVRHCALSLVGEPILYPYIVECLDELHRRRISSFLVTNAQFPDQMRSIMDCTQFYVSVDASNKEKLKRLDQPIFRDFWERFLECLDVLSKVTRMRTVFRMTLVKGYNVVHEDEEQEMKDYADLILKGNPCFVEVKGFTYCGDNTKLSMENVPWHEEVLGFAKKLGELSPQFSKLYEIACVHRHSCSVLLGRKDFCIEGTWRTWIDYDRFFDLVDRRKSCKNFDYAPLDYSIPTPCWARAEAEEEGFDPAETRFYGKSKNKNKMRRVGVEAANTSLELRV